MDEEKADKPILFLGDSMDSLTEFPLEVKKQIGFGLRMVQKGLMPDNSKPLKGPLTGISEIVADDRSGTFRGIYTAKLSGRVYVLHCFQKKSKRGIATPQKDIELIKNRYRIAVEVHKEWLKERDEA